MEIRVLLRGGLAGLIAGVLGFAFAWVFAEPVIGRAIDYESGRDDVLAALARAAGQPTEPDGPDIVARGVQSTLGAATGIVAFSVAMGALVAVAYLVLHGRFRVRPRALAWTVAGFGFLGVFLLPFVKYPANPPSIGHPFTIETRGDLYLVMVAASLVLLGLAAWLGRRLLARFGAVTATVLAAVAFLVVFGVLIGLLPGLGDLSANLDHATDAGFAHAATETPQPITNVGSTPVVVDGRTFAPGQIVYPGFDPDLLWKFRWYSLIEQALVWITIALVFGALLERLVPASQRDTAGATRGEPAAAR